MSDQKQAELYTFDDEGGVHWWPHWYQNQALKSRAREIFLAKGWRAGFSSIMPRWLELEMIRCGPGSENLAYFVIAPTLKVATKPGSIQKTIHSYFTNVMGYTTYNQSNHTFLTTKEGEQKLWGHEQRERTPITVCYAEDPDSFASATFLGGIGDEVGQKKFPRESWNVLGARMMTTIDRPARNNPPGMRGMGCGRVCAGSTVYTLNWFVEKYEEYKKFRIGERAKLMRRLREEGDEGMRRKIWAEYREREEYGQIHPDMHFIRFDSLENPTTSQKKIEEYRTSWPSWFFDMRIRAIPRRPAGTIHEYFDSNKHVIPRFEIPANARRIGSIDFGRKNFYATVRFFDETEKRWIAYAAYHRPDLKVEDHGTKLLELFPEVTEWVAGQPGEEHERQQLAAGGLASHAPEFRALWTGINNLSAAIKLDEVYYFDDLRPARISPDKAINYIDEIKEQYRTYSRPVDDDGKVDVDAKEPEDKDKFHWMDEARYFGTVVFSGYHEGTVLAANRNTAQSADVALVSATPQQPARTSSDIAIASGMGDFHMERYGHRHDPLF